MYKPNVQMYIYIYIQREREREREREDGRSCGLLGGGGGGGGARTIVETVKGPSCRELPTESVHMTVYTYIHMVYMYTCIYIYIYAHVYIYIYIYIYRYTDMHLRTAFCLTSATGCETKGFTPQRGIENRHGLCQCSDGFRHYE